MHRALRKTAKAFKKFFLFLLLFNLVFQNTLLYAQEITPEASPSAVLGETTPTPTPDPTQTVTPTPEISTSPTPVPEVSPEASPSATPLLTPSPEATATTSPTLSIRPEPTTAREQTAPQPQSETPTPTETINNQQTISDTPQPEKTALESFNELISASTQSAELNGIKLKLPFAGDFPVSQGFGKMPDDRWLENQYLKAGLIGHDGIDFELPKGTPVLSSYEGVVLSSGPGIYGTTVVIGHSWGMTYYGHLSEASSLPGQVVRAGQLIGYSGNTGLTTGPHLHFGLKPKNPDLRNGYFGMIDPSFYLDLKPQTEILGATTRRRGGRRIKNFRNDENPEIELTIDDTNLSYKLVDPEGKQVKIPKRLNRKNSRKFFRVEANQRKIPGKYTLVLSNAQGEQEVQEFTWGVLALNFNKATYLTEETAKLSMAVLDDKGEMVCDATVDLTINGPNGSTVILSTDNGSIKVNKDVCLSKNVTTVADYEAQYEVNSVGTYQLTLTAVTGNGEREIKDSFVVENDQDFSVERTSATRLYPVNKYPMTIVVEANKDFKGRVFEETPSEFSIDGSTSWEVDWKKGEKYELNYTYDAPDASPAYYEIGPLHIGQDYKEGRKWQLAIDATTTVDFSSCAGGNTCDTSTTYWASADDVDVFPFANTVANRNTHTELADADYTALSASDNSVQASANPGTADEIFMWFEMPIAETVSTISQIDFTYEGSTTSTANFQIYVKDDSVSYENDVAWVEVGAAQSITASTETSFTRSLSGTDFSRFIDANGVITWAVYEDISAVVVSTDYVKLDVITNTVEQEGYRFRNDDGSETTATWLAAQDTNITQPTATNTRLRTILNDTTGGDQATTQYQLEYKLSSDTVYRPVQSSSGSIAYSSNGTSSGALSTILTIDAPATVDRGDLLVMGISNKYPTNGPTTPTGWTAITNNQASGGSGAAGIDSGDAYSTVFVREAEGWEDGVTFTVSIPSSNTSEGQILRFTKGTGKEWDLAATTGSDTTMDTTWSATGVSTLDITAGDIVVSNVGVNADKAGWSGHGLSAAGLSSITTTERSETSSTAGDDTKLVMITHAIGAGTATGAPTHTATLTDTSAGAVVFLRIRQVDAPIQLSASSNITASGENTTAQLTAPAGSPTFTAGRMQDDENPADTVDINDSQYTEMEWSMTATTAATNGEVYQFRVTANGQVLTTYTVTPQWTIGGGATYNQPHFRIRNGDTVGLNTDNDWATFLDANATINAGGKFRVRIEVEESTGLGASKSFKLQYRFKPNGSSYGGWSDVPDRAVAGEDGPIHTLASDQYADGDVASTNLLAGSAETFDAGGTGEENRSTGALTISNEHAEYEFTLMIRGTYGGPTRVKDGDQFDLRIVESDGTPFNGTYVNPTITVEMPDYYIGSPTVETPGRIGPFKDTNGNLYYFIEPTFITGTGNNEPEMLKSTDGGKSWDLVGTSGSPTSNDVEAADVYQSGDTLHICMQTGGTNDPVVYHTFRMSDHPTNADTWGIIDESVDSSTIPTDQSCGIVKRSDGTVVVAYRYGDGTNSRVGYRIRSTGGTWGAENNLDTTASTDFVFSGIVLGASDKTHIFYKDDTNNILYHKSLSSADVLSSAVTVEADAEADPDDWSATPPIYWDDGGNEKIMTLVRDNSSGFVYSVVITNDGTPETRKEVAGTNIRHDPPGTTNESLIADLVIDSDTKTQYSVFVPISDYDLYMDTATNDGGWTTDVKIKTFTSGEYVRGNIFTHNTGNGGNKVYGLIYEDNGQGDSGFSWYHEVNLNPNGHSFQRKTWYDGTRYWRSSYDGISGLIKFEYSTNGTSWTEDTSARITSTNGNYSVYGDSSNAYVAYQTASVENTDTLVNNGMVGYWKMNESSWNGTSNEVVDSSGNSFHGTASGNATTTIGKYSNSGIYDGSGDYFTVSDNASLRPGTGSFSMSMWINPTNVNQATVIAGKMNTTTGEGYAFGMFDTLAGASGKKITWGCRETYTGNRRLVITSSNVVDGSWHHIAGVCNSSTDTVKLYIDGVEASVTSDNAGTWPTVDDTTNFIAGQAGSSYYYSGLMDDMRVYNRALSETEIASMAKPGYDIEVKKASSYPGTGFSWGNADVALNGNSSTDMYQYPVVAYDSNSKLLVGGINKNSTNYIFKTTRSTSANDITAWDASSSLDSSTNGNKYGVVVPRTTGAAYAAWIDSTTIEGKNYNGTSWDGSPTTIATGVSGITTSLSGVGDSSGNVHLAYIDSSNQMVYKKYSGSWETAAPLDQNTGNAYPTISRNSSTSDLYAFWVRSSDIFYKKGTNISSTGSSLLFDATNDYVKVPYNANFDQTTDLTVEFWFTPGTTINTSSTGYKGLISKAFSNTDSENDWVFFWETGEAGKMRFGTYGDNVKTTTDTWTAGTWYHMAATVDASNNAYIYVNGVQDNFGGDTSVSTNPINGTQNTDLNIGLSKIASGDTYFDGKIDDVRIYNTARTQAQIQSDMFTELSGSETNLIGYWNMNDGTGQTVSDLDSNNNDGTLGADGTSSTDDPTWSSTLPFTHSWDATATSWQTTGTLTYPSSNYSDSNKIFAQWYDGTAVDWDQLSIGNTSPNSPSSLAQKTTGDVTVSTGGWLNSTSVKFTASASDPDASDTLYLCVEKDILGTGFSNTEDSCGTGVAYSGSPISVSVTIASQTDASEYHWQARVKDTAGAYSSWVSYDVNAESARDYGIDTSAPTGGTVYDGTSTGVDGSFNDGSLSSLSANWDSFNSNVSGLASYDYSIGTTAGATDVKTWTGNGTTTSVTATGLTLQTSQIYYFNVRATDNAGNSSVVSSNGQMIQPSLFFSIDTTSLSFSNLNPGNSFTDTKNTVITTSTNAYNGFVIRGYKTDFLRSIIYPSTTIADFSAGTYAAPSSWSGNGLGYTSSDTLVQGAAKFPSSGSCLGTGTAPCYAPFSSTGPGDIVADHTSNVSGSPVTNEQYTLTYKVATSNTQAAGPYSTTVVYTVAAQY